MRYVSVVVLIAVSAHFGYGSPSGADQPNPLLERQVSVKGQIQCGGVPAKNVSVALLLVDFSHIPQSTKFEEWGELTKRREYYAPVPPAQAEGAWYYGTINAGDVDEDGRFEVGGKVLVAGKDDRVFAYQLSVRHHCKNGSEQAEYRRTHYATIRFASSSKKPDVYDFDLANHLEPRDPYDYPD